MKNKESEISFLNEEFVKANHKIELIRQDRMHDQQLISDLQTQNAFLSLKISELAEVNIQVRPDTAQHSRQNKPQANQVKLDDSQ
jgi:hypothetical protein